MAIASSGFTVLYVCSTFVLSYLALSVVKNVDSSVFGSCLEMLWTYLGIWINLKSWHLPMNFYCEKESPWVCYKETNKIVLALGDPYIVSVKAGFSQVGHSISGTRHCCLFLSPWSWTQWWLQHEASLSLTLWDRTWKAVASAILVLQQENQHLPHSTLGQLKESWLQQNVLIKPKLLTSEV